MMIELNSAVPTFSPPRNRDHTDFVLGMIFAPPGHGSEAKYAQWTRQLADESMDFLARQRARWLKNMEREELYNQATGCLIQEICRRFNSFASAFNQAIGDRDLYVTLTEASIVTEVVRYNKFREAMETVTNFRARLSTRHMSLVMKGFRNEITFVLLPGERVLGLSRTEKDFKIEARLTARFTHSEERPVWKSEGRDLTDEKLDKICKALFRKLIVQTREQSAGVTAI